MLSPQRIKQIDEICSKIVETSITAEIELSPEFKEAALKQGVGSDELEEWFDEHLDKMLKRIFPQGK